LQQDLARALGISAPMVSRLKRQGMPTHSVAAAIEWRSRNLDPLHVHEQATRRGRAIPAAPAHEQAAHAPPTDRTAALENIGLLAELAARDFAAYGERLRAALAALPREAWDEVALPVSVWDRLGGEAFATIDKLVAEARAPGDLEEPAAGADGDVAADLVYEIAAGLVRVEAVHMSPLAEIPGPEDLAP
jgi:hypothetical protein